MAWQDRPYYRDRDDTSGSPLMWLLNGSVPLFTAFEIRVRAHASLIVCSLLILIFGLGKGFYWQDRVESLSILFVVILLHEFGHCFAARWVGGDADEILMTPLGGLAMAQAPHRWWPTLITVAGGPAVNVVICVGCAALLFIMGLAAPLNPFYFTAPHSFGFSWLDLHRYVFFTYAISYSLLIFNLLPFFPLDGGQMLLAVMWWRIGYYRAALIAGIVGMVGGGAMLIIAIPTFSILLALIGVNCFVNSLNLRRATVAAGPEEYADNIDYSAAYEPATPKRKRSRLNQRAIKKARRLLEEARLEQEHIDQILAKVSASGMASLTWMEKRALRKATEHRRKRDLELSQ